MRRSNTCCASRCASAKVQEATAAKARTKAGEPIIGENVRLCCHLGRYCTLRVQVERLDLWHLGSSSATVFIPNRHEALDMDRRRGAVRSPGEAAFELDGRGLPPRHYTPVLMLEPRVVAGCLER